MSNVKKIAFSLCALAFALIVLRVVLRFASKVPVIGGLANDVQNLTTDGTL